MRPYSRPENVLRFSFAVISAKYFRELIYVTGCRRLSLAKATTASALTWRGNRTKFEISFRTRRRPSKTVCIGRASVHTASWCTVISVEQISADETSLFFGFPSQSHSSPRRFAVRILITMARATEKACCVRGTLRTPRINCSFNENFLLNYILRGSSCSVIGRHYLFFCALLRGEVMCTFTARLECPP